jgi:hypothetical protein|tara:strand:+ start:585 stop:692 length:108 start_codon:yes stop_codon:yes gene_type:complete
METFIELIILTGIILFIINKKKPEWIDWLKSKIRK